MTPRRFDALKQRIFQLVDDPEERKKLLRSVLAADDLRLRVIAAKQQRGIDGVARRNQRLHFLLDGVAALMPEIHDPWHIPLGELIQQVQSTQPDLAAQLRAFLYDR